MAPSPIDRALDWTVVPGYSRLGYAIRRRGWPEPPGTDALAGRSVIVTGAGAGIGAATCELLARRGASVHMLVRDRDRGERARARIRERTRSAELVVELCDVSSLAAIRDFAAGFAPTQPLQALVNNAGVMPPERTRTPEGFELGFATNVLGPFLLTALLVPLLRRAASSRIVNVSSGGMYTQRLRVDDLELERRDYEPAASYAHAKRCQVILSGLWAERLRGSTVSAHSMHPGWADTPGVRASLPRFHRLVRPLLRTPEQGADTVAWLASAPEPGARPGLFWHDREPRPVHRVPWTREAPADRERLWDQCSRLAGWGEGGSIESAPRGR